MSKQLSVIRNFSATGRTCAQLATITAARMTRLIESRRHPSGALIVWLGPDWHWVDPEDVVGSVDMNRLFPDCDCPAGWSVCWDERAPSLTGPDRVCEPLAAGQMMVVAQTPPARFIWFPDGLKDSWSGEPPGRPAAGLIPVPERV
jgi:hypothetical protein